MTKTYLIVNTYTTDLAYNQQPSLKNMKSAVKKRNVSCWFPVPFLILCLSPKPENTI